MSMVNKARMVGLVDRLCGDQLRAFAERHFQGRRQAAKDLCM